MLVGEDFIDETMLDVDAAGICTRKIANQLFEGRRVPERIVFEDGQEFDHPGFQAACRKLFRILDGVPGKDDLPFHHLSAFALLPSGSAIPCLIESRMPGTESR